MSELKEADKVLAKIMHERGFHYEAKYIEKFGSEALNPSYNRQQRSTASERFYKKCLDEGHPYDYYFEIPDGAII